MAATGWHNCERDQVQGVWRAGTLHAGNLDATSSLWALARRLVPLDVLRGKLDPYIEAGHLHASERDAYIETLERMHGVLREYNVHAQTDGAEAPGATLAGAMMTGAELRANRGAEQGDPLGPVCCARVLARVAAHTMEALGAQGISC